MIVVINQLSSMFKKLKKISYRYAMGKNYERKDTIFHNDVILS